MAHKKGKKKTTTGYSKSIKPKKRKKGLLGSF